MAKWIIKLIVLFWVVGCSSISSELQTKERLLLSSGENQQLVEFYKGNLALRDPLIISPKRNHVRIDFEQARLQLRASLPSLLCS